MPKKRLDKILVIDVESTCWEGKTHPNQISEIIEIGLAVYDVQKGEATEKVGWLVKPVQSEISAFCTSLTTITPEMIEKEGIDLAEACKVLKEQYQASQRPWASWGDYDRSQVEKNCAMRLIPYPFSKTHFNLKSLFSLKNKLSNELGMSSALEFVGLPLSGTHHRGIDDAWNITKLLHSILS